MEKFVTSKTEEKKIARKARHDRFDRLVCLNVFFFF